MEHKRDFKTLAGFVLLCLSVGMGMGTAKTHIYEAIKDYKDHKRLERARIESLEHSEDMRNIQMQRINDKLNKVLGNR